MNSAISLENVKKTLGSREVLKGISFTVDRGDIFGYLGLNGAGKTTTIRILLGLLQANSGKAYILGLDINLSETRRRVGFVLDVGGLSHRTVQYHYRILSKALEVAIKMGLILVNPCKGVTPPKSAHTYIPAIGPDDLAELLNGIRQSSYYLYYHTLLLTGLRRSELLALKWKDLDLELACVYVSHSLHRLDDGTIIIKEPKTSRSRRPVDLPLSLVTLLRQHRVDQEVQRLMLGKSLTEDDFVFSHVDGSLLNPNTVTHTFAKVVSRAGLPHLRLHDLRHIHATMLLKAGVHPRVVQERLGHSSIATTLDIYSHTVPGLQKAAAERLDTLLP